jgi:hypothetical protein
MIKMENEELLQELEDARKKIAKYDEERKSNFIRAIKKFGDKYSDEELEEKDLETLEIVYDACKRFSDIAIEPEIPTPLPMGNKIDEKEIPTRIDFARIWEDVSKDFNMEGLKY